jgi:hypothetical protein
MQSLSIQSAILFFNLALECLSHFSVEDDACGANPAFKYCAVVNVAVHDLPLALLGSYQQTRCRLKYCCFARNTTDQALLQFEVEKAFESTRSHGELMVCMHQVL